MPFSGRRYITRSVSHVGSHHQDSNNFGHLPMSEGTWQALCNAQTHHGNPAISPEAFQRGPPPDPKPSDSYDNKWLKLVWMELYDSVIAFEREQAKKREPFKDRATLSVDVQAYDAQRQQFSVVIAGNDAKNHYVLPADLSAADFVHALLRLEPGSGWVYVKHVKTDSGSGANGVTAFAQIYDDNFELSESNPDESADESDVSESLRHFRQPCVLFDSFSGCLARFYALHRYPTVHASVRAAIEASNALGLEPAPAPTLRDVPHARDSKLNASQLSILKKVQGPVDFVQGPPGTGKSTVIVELLEVCS